MFFMFSGHFSNFIEFFYFNMWNLDDLKSFQLRNFSERAFQLKIMPKFVFFLDYLKMQFRGFANAYAGFSRD